MELGASEAVKYADSILAAIQRERLPEEAERGMMRYYCFANGLVAGVALVGFTVLAPEQIGIDGDLTKIQTDAEYLVWYHKIVFLCAALGPFVETQFIPPVLS